VKTNSYALGQADAWAQQEDSASGRADQARRAGGRVFRFKVAV